MNFIIIIFEDNQLNFGEIYLYVMLKKNDICFSKKYLLSITSFYVDKFLNFDWSKVNEFK